jgi:hypothetical protein
VSNANAQLVEIYTLLSRSALNKEYYGIRLHRTQRWNDVLEIAIAIGTTGSGISALTLWKVQPWGPYVWGTMTVVSAVLAVVKPIIQLNKRMERLTRLYLGHTDNYTNLLVLVSRIQRHGTTTPELLSLFETAEAKFQELSKDDDPHPNTALLRRCEAAVRKRHPADLAWYPDETATSQTVNPLPARSL